MGKRSDQRAQAISITLPPELARAVAQRVDSGLYSSASEVIREALRLLLDRESQATRGASPTGTELQAAGSRLAWGFELAELGMAMRRQRLGGDAALVAESPGGAEQSQEPAVAAGELGPDLRLAPDRLQRLRRDV